MQVMKFSNGRDACKSHFEKSHTGYVVDLLWTQRQSTPVHDAAPGPEVRTTPAPRLCLASQCTLKGVRMNIDHARKQRTSWHAMKSGAAIGSCGRAYGDNVSCIIHLKCITLSKATIDKE
jgi:hypothetical protein